MKKLMVKSFLLALLIGFTANAQAQIKEVPAPAPTQEQVRKMTPTERAEKMTERMSTKLELNDKQRAEVLRINIRYAQEREQMHEAVKEQKRASKDAQAADLKSVLTPEQYAKMEIAMKKREERRKGKRGHKREHAPRNG